MDSMTADPQITAPQPSPVELEVRRIRELSRSRRHAEALAGGRGAAALRYPKIATYSI